MQRELFGVQHTDVGVSLRNIICHGGRIRPDLVVHVRSPYVEDALLAKLGARFQENLLDLHYIAFTPHSTPESQPHDRNSHSRNSPAEDKSAMNLRAGYRNRRVLQPIRVRARSPLLSTQSIFIVFFLDS